ncbi:hypothetical protein GCM10017691_20810 [Pseudonocardia petroleophila]
MSLDTATDGLRPSSTSRAVVELGRRARTGGTVVLEGHADDQLAGVRSDPGDDDPSAYRDMLSTRGSRGR